MAGNDVTPSVDFVSADSKDRGKRKDHGGGKALLGQESDTYEGQKQTCVIPSATLVEW